MVAKPRKRATDHQPPGWLVNAFGLVLLLTQVIVLTGADSPFRESKWAVAVGGLALVLAGALAHRLRTGSLSIPRNRLALILAAYPLMQLVSALWAGRPREAVASATTSAVWVLAVLVVSTFDASRQRRLAGWAAAGMVLSCLVVLAEFVGVTVLSHAADQGSRIKLAGLTGNPADLAMAAILLLPLLLIPAGRSTPDRRGWVATAVLAFAAAGTRTLTAMVALGLLLLVWLLVRGSRRMWITSAAALVLVVSAALVSGVGERLTYASQQLRSGDWYALLSARGDGWTAAVEMITEHPVLGVGAGNFGRAFYPARVAWLERHGGTGRRGELATHFEWAHCDPLQVLAELGLSGGVWLVVLTVVLVTGWRRGHPLPALAAAAAAPFVFLHYPGHLAVSLVPITLLVARMLPGDERWDLRLSHTAARNLTAVVVLVAGVWIAGWQLGRLRSNSWLGVSEWRLVTSQSLDRGGQAVVLAEVIRGLEQRIGTDRGSAPQLYRQLGRARLVNNDPRGAEDAFRAAYSLSPHEEAEFGLGLSLAAQGRRSEAIRHLGRVCRTNPRLAELISDPGLRRAVEELVASY